MKICSNCGTQNQDNALFCGGCGGVFQAPPAQPAPPAEPVQAAQPVQAAEPAQPVQPVQPAAPQYTAPEQQYAQTPAPAPAPAPVEKFDEDDVRMNRAMGILSYVIGPLVLIPCFLTKHSPYTRFHNNQGLIITIGTTAYGIFQAIFMAILGLIFPYRYSYDIFSYLEYARSPVYTVFEVLLSLGYLFFVVLIVLGIISAIKGTKNELPLVGKIKIFK